MFFSIIVFQFCKFLQFLLSVGNNILVNLWGDKVDVPMHLLHMCFGIGWSISPALTYPFLSDAVNITESYSQDITDNTTLSNWTTDRTTLSNWTTDRTTLSNWTTDITTLSNWTTEITTLSNWTGVISNTSGLSDLDSRRTQNFMIAIPFFFVGSLLYVFGVIFICSHLRGQPVNLEQRAKSRSNIREVLNPGSCAGGHRHYGILITAIFAGNLLNLQFIHYDNKVHTISA